MIDTRRNHVLITGGGGFLGSNLLAKLLARGHDVHAILRPTTDPWRIEHLLPRIHVHRGSLVDEEFLRSTVRGVRPSLIFHLASTGAYTESSERRRMFDDNLAAAHNLLEAVRDFDFRRLVVAGSSLAYGWKQQPMREDDVLEPRTYYAATRAAAMLLFQQAAVGEGRPIAVLRIFSIYGPGEPKKRLIPSAIRAAMTGEVLPLAEGYVRDFIFVDDVSAACLAAAETDPASGEIFNIGSGVETANEEVVRCLESCLGRKIRVDPGGFPPRATDTKSWRADIGKARRILGWQPQFSLRDGLLVTSEWVLNHRRHYDIP
jgi:nucleoside-diphosphate-sugar epimerase